MQVTLDLWHVISLAVSFFGASAAAGKLLLSQTQRHLDERFNSQESARAANHDQVSRRLDSMEASAREEMGNWQRIERDLLKLQADMPIHYVRREDYIRGQSVIEAKLDALGNKLELAQLRVAAAGGANDAKH
jgi:hypothetical protein